MQENTNPDPVLREHIDDVRQYDDVSMDPAGNGSAIEPTTSPEGAHEGNNGSLKTKLAIGLTIAATAIANVAAGTPKIVERVDVPLGGSNDGVAKKHPEPAIGFSVPSEKWAERFSDDKDAGELTAPTELSKVTDKIDELIGAGKRIESIEVQGFASAEESTQDRTAGLQDVDKRNVKLAGMRSSTFSDILAEKMDEKNIKIPEIIEKTPIEDFLSDDEVKSTSNLTKKYGYKDMQSMIEAYNREENVPDEVRKDLDVLLKSERKVEVTIHSNSEVAYASAEQDEDKITIPIPLLLIIPIPKIARRRKLSTEPLAEPSLNNSAGENRRREIKRKDEAFKMNVRSVYSADIVRDVYKRKQPRPHNQGPQQRKIHGRKRDRGGSTRSTRA